MSRLSAKVIFVGRSMSATGPSQAFLCRPGRSKIRVAIRQFSLRPSPLTLDKCPHCGSQLRSGTRHVILRLPGELYVGTEAILAVHGGNKSGLCFRSRSARSRLGNLRRASCLFREGKQRGGKHGRLDLLGWFDRDRPLYSLISRLAVRTTDALSQIAASGGDPPTRTHARQTFYNERRLSSAG